MLKPTLTLLFLCSCIMPLTACSSAKQERSAPQQSKLIQPYTAAYTAKHKAGGIAALKQSQSTISQPSIDLRASQTFTATHLPNTQSLNGRWQFFGSGHKNSPSIKVPSNWNLQGHYGHGKKRYQHTFTVKHNSDEHFRLNFEGVDYIANVTLNGQHLGRHEGYFDSFSYNVGQWLNKHGDNHLMVEVDSPIERKQDYSLNKRLIKGVLAHHDTRPGGAWSKHGQDKNTGGIWGNVSLSSAASDLISNIDARVHAKDDGLTDWQVGIKVSHHLQKHPSIEFHWQVEPLNTTGISYQGISRSSQFSVHIKHPALWWPKSLGKPNLYRLQVDSKLNGKTLASEHQTLAFRTVRVDKDNAWHINNKRVLLLGTNAIPSLYLSELSELKLRKEITQMQTANMNAVRVHAHVTRQRFYDLCDQMGMLVWQDFPLQWGYQDSKAFHKKAALQLTRMITQLNRHPSIIHWTIHNEPPWDAKWMKFKYKNYDPQHNKALDEALTAQAKQLDTTRHITSHSATLEHPWLGWYSGKLMDYANKPAKTAFISEFGAQALPNHAVLERILGPSPRLPSTDKGKDWSHWSKWQYHNFQPRETFTIANIKAGDSVHSLINNTQRYQANVNQIAAESYRRQAFKPVTAVFQFMFKEHWPSMSWGMVDYLGQPKVGYHTLKNAYSPVLASAEFKRLSFSPGPLTLNLWAINDSLKNKANSQYYVRLMHEGKAVDARQYSVDINADQRAVVTTYTSPHLKSGHYRMVLSIKDKQKRLLSQNQYQFEVVDKQQKTTSASIGKEG